MRREEFSEHRLYNILSHYCDEEEKVKIEPADLGLISNGMTMRPDLYLPDGCKALKLKPKTIIEVRSELDFDTLQTVRVIYDNFYDILRQNGLNFLCVIMYYQGRLSFIIPFNEIPLIGRIREDFQIKSLDELLEDVSKNLDTQELKKQDKQEMAKKKAASAIMSEPCSFILGAGVSVDAGLPSWDNLLKRLIVKAKKDHKLEMDQGDYDSLFKDCGSSSIILGRLIQTLFHEDEEKFKNAIHQALYQGETYQPGNLAKAICNLIKYKYDQKLMTSIITYNYDDLIEQGLSQMKLVNIPVFSAQRQASYVPVYHVHGFLPKGYSKYSTLVLSEKEYHDIYKEAYHWSNVEQLHAMQRSVCFFIGLSMTDPNLRRLLDIAYGERRAGTYHDIRHFAFLCRGDVSKGLKGKKAEEFRLSMEDMLKGLGVAVVWYNKYADLPTILNGLAK